MNSPDVSPGELRHILLALAGGVVCVAFDVLWGPEWALAAVGAWVAIRLAVAAWDRRRAR